MALRAEPQGEQAIQEGKNMYRASNGALSERSECPELAEERERAEGLPFPSILLGVVSLSNHGSEPEAQPQGRRQV